MGRAGALLGAVMGWVRVRFSCNGQGWGVEGECNGHGWSLVGDCNRHDWYP